MKYVAAFLLLLCLPATAAAQEDAAQKGTLTIRVTTLQNASGTLDLALYESARGFPSDTEQSVRRMSIDLTERLNSDGGTVEVVFEDVPFETYAISMRHDENTNDKLDTNWIGIPKEGVGFSNNASARFGPPDFAEASFQLNAPQKQLSMNIRY